MQITFVCEEELPKNKDFQYNKKEKGDNDAIQIAKTKGVSILTKT
jgi:hypothetical protein